MLIEHIKGLFEPHRMQKCIWEHAKDFAQLICGLSCSLTISVVWSTLPLTSIFSHHCKCVRKLCWSNLYLGQCSVCSQKIWVVFVVYFITLNFFSHTVKRLLTQWTFNKVVHEGMWEQLKNEKNQTENHSLWSTGRFSKSPPVLLLKAVLHPGKCLFY